MNSTSGGSMESEVITLKLDFEEWSVIDACLGATESQILLKPEVAKQALTRQEDEVLARVQATQALVQSVAMEATRLLPPTKLKIRLDKAVAFTSLLTSTLASVEEALADRHRGQ